MMVSESDFCFVFSDVDFLVASLLTVLEVPLLTDRWHKCYYMASVSTAGPGTQTCGPCAIKHSEIIKHYVKEFS